MPAALQPRNVEASSFNITPKDTVIVDVVQTDQIYGEAWDEGGFIIHYANKALPSRIPSGGYILKIGVAAEDIETSYIWISVQSTPSIAWSVNRLQQGVAVSRLDGRNEVVQEHGN